jgi:homoaconitase/3-isopropylmalate dehydratase large subunit
MPIWRRQTTTLTTGRELGIDGITDETSCIQVVTLTTTAALRHRAVRHPRRSSGIVHVRTEQGRNTAGLTIVCGDSHTYAWRVVRWRKASDFGSRACTRHSAWFSKTGNMEIRTVGVGHGLFAKDPCSRSSGGSAPRVEPDKRWNFADPRSKR